MVVMVVVAEALAVVASVVLTVDEPEDEMVALCEVVADDVPVAL